MWPVIAEPQGRRVMGQLAAARRRRSWLRTRTRPWMRWQASLIADGHSWYERPRVPERNAPVLERAGVVGAAGSKAAATPQAARAEVRLPGRTANGTRPGPVAARSAVPRGVGHWRFMPRPAATVSWLVHTTHEDRRWPQVAPRRPLTAAAPFFYPGAGQLKARSLSRNRETWLTNSSGYWNSAPCAESG